ncbi:hypothetical protein BV898_19425 [Hypsibius exemplaris]|uniref:Uncharacterized protein n=1 Tax=Hypsibius exemplaris TaxID=2072580 RepID=A0A9X6RPK8_HYPEX|nr:hypothetical protein BV898_19425 [Hypsibius exemplaris]
MLLTMIKLDHRLIQLAWVPVPGMAAPPNLLAALNILRLPVVMLPHDYHHGYMPQLIGRTNPPQPKYALSHMVALNTNRTQPRWKVVA